MYRVLILLLSCSLLATPVIAFAQSPLNVVATTTNMGMLAQTVGGEAVTIRTLAPPDRDAHHLQVRPSMMAALRRADLVVAVGADLEIGWLPPAIRGAANPRVQPGRSGYFEAAASVDLLDAGRPADRSLGDVHPDGNPHFYLDPVRMGEAALALAERMAQLRPEQAQQFRANATAFVTDVEARLPDWQARTAGAAGIVMFHEDARYLADRLGIPVLGFIEPVPGIPPTASHLNDLVTRLAGQSGTIIHAPHHPARGPAFLGRELGWPVRELAHDVPADRLDSESWFALIEHWVEALAHGATQ